MVDVSKSDEGGRWAWIFGNPRASRTERAFAWLTSAVVALGLFMRVRGYLFDASAFWLDECSWAMMTVEEPFKELAIRPIGFMGLSRLLATLIAPTETVLRAMPWLAGLFTTVVTVPLGRRLFATPAARLLFVSIIALHPGAIDLSKEYKPYSVSFALHLAVMLLALLYVETRRSSSLWALLVTAALGGLFAQDLIFAYPGAFLLVGWVALRDHKQSHAYLIAGAAGLILLLLLGQYLYLWRNVTASDTQTFGDKYNVFFSRNSGQTRSVWALTQQLDMGAFPGLRRNFWRAGLLKNEPLDVLRTIDHHVWTALHVAGVVLLLLLRSKRTLLLLLPLGVLWIFNTGGMWPVGAFRTNLFVLGYVSAIACVALDVGSSKLVRFGDVVPALVLVFLPLALLDPKRSAYKQALTTSSSFPQALKKLAKLKRSLDPKPRATLLLDRRSCDPYRYYTQFHPDTKPLGAQLAQQFDVRCIEKDVDFEPALNASAPLQPHLVWVLVHNDNDARRWVRRRRHGKAILKKQASANSHSIAAFFRRGTAADEAAAAAEPPADPEPSEAETDDASPEPDSPDQGSR